MKISELRALGTGARLLFGVPGEQVTPVILDAVIEAQPPARSTDVRVLGWDGEPRTTPARYLKAAPPAAHPDTVMVRPELDGATITVERITALMWSRLGMARGVVGQCAVIERRDGRLHRVCCVASDLWGGGDLETAAKAYADEAGARYVPNGGVMATTPDGWPPQRVDEAAPAYPAPGSEIPDQPGYVVLDEAEQDGGRTDG